MIKRYGVVIVVLVFSFLGYGRESISPAIRIRSFFIETDDFHPEYEEPIYTYKNGYIKLVPLYDMITPKYRFRNMFDGDSKTAFVVKQRAFLAIKFLLDKPISIDRIRIFNGYGESKDLYLKNLRFVRVRISLGKINEYGEFTNTYLVTPNGSFPLPDKFDYIEIPIYGQEEYNHFSFYFEDNYTNGVIYDDMCISEIQLWYRGERYNIENLEDVEKVIRYGSPATQGHWVGESIKYKKRPKLKSAEVDSKSKTENRK